MGKALACHAGGWGLNLDKTKLAFFCLENNQMCALILSDTPPCALSPIGSFLQELGVNMFLDTQKKRE